MLPNRKQGAWWCPLGTAFYSITMQYNALRHDDITITNQLISSLGTAAALPAYSRICVVIVAS